VQDLVAVRVKVPRVALARFVVARPVVIVCEFFCSADAYQVSFTPRLRQDPGLAGLVTTAFGTTSRDVATPSGGTGSFAVHAIALSSILLIDGFFRLARKWPPVKPKDRPPLGRSKAHATVCFPSGLLSCGRRIGTIRRALG
jgi:hypothetical protein